jgi:hypothetical protein
MFLVSTLVVSLSNRAKDRSGEEMFKPISMRTSSKVGVIGPWLNKKALRASNQKKEADISISLFLIISDKERFMH